MSQCRPELPSFCDALGGSPTAVAPRGPAHAGHHHQDSHCWAHLNPIPPPRGPEARPLPPQHIVPAACRSCPCLLSVSITLCGQAACAPSSWAPTPRAGPSHVHGLKQQPHSSCNLGLGLTSPTTLLTTGHGPSARRSPQGCTPPLTHSLHLRTSPALPASKLLLKMFLLE